MTSKYYYLRSAFYKAIVALQNDSSHDLAKQLKTNSIHYYRTFTIHGEMVIITVWEKLIAAFTDNFKEFNFSEGSNYRCGGNNKKTRISSGSCACE